MQHQASWLSKERGGSIPPEVMESFGKLLDLADKHQVSFEELCVYALNEANKEKEKGEGAGAVPDAAPTMPDEIKIDE